MTVCDLLSGTGRLQKATVELGRKWEDTRESWQDETAREFERLYLRSLPSRIRLVLTAASELNELLRKAERDCADERGEVF
jgi:hypothetical protein